MVRGETYVETNNLSSWWFMAMYVEIYVRCSKKESKTKMGYRETQSSTSPDNWEEYSSLNQTTKNSIKLTMKAARRKLEVTMPAAMPCKIPLQNSGETHRNIGKRKTKYACVVDVDECTRPRLEGAGHKPHQEYINAKGRNSTTHYSLVHKFIPMPQARKIPDAKAAAEKEWEI